MSLFESCAIFGSKLLDIEFCTNCIFEDETTKVVVLLPFFEEGMANPVAQRNEHHSRKGFLALSQNIVNVFLKPTNETSLTSNLVDRKCLSIFPAWNQREMGIFPGQIFFSNYIQKFLLQKLTFLDIYKTYTKTLRKTGKKK